MSTAPLNPLVTQIRSKYPGAYDDMDDATLTKSVLAKYPQYSDLAAPSPAASVAQPSAPQSSMLDKILGFAGQYPGQGFKNEYGVNVNVPGKSLVPSTPEDQASQASQMVKAGQMVLGGGGIKNVASEAVDLLPSTKRAGEAFKDVASKVGSNIVDPNPAGAAALKIQESAQAGGTMPKVIRDYLNATTKPGAAPLDFDTARKFYQNANALSFAENSRLTPAAKYSLNEFRVALGNSIKDTAQAGGVGDQFGQAMSEYGNAKTLNKAVKTVVKAGVKYVVPAAAAGIAGEKIAKALGR